jgi:nicotinate-nucleotide pyrophosphorylase
MSMEERIVPEKTALVMNTDTHQGVVAGVPFFDEVFKQLDCTYVIPHSTIWMPN